MEVKAELKYLRISPRKAKIAADIIRGLSVNDAQRQLKVLVKRSSKPLEKLLESAIANAKNNFEMEESNLAVSKIFVNEGPALKRWIPRAMGRATQILKRSSHITIVLSEIELGQKSAKSKAKVEKFAKKETEEIAETKETREAKKPAKQVFGRIQKDQAGIKGSQSVDTKKKFQRRKAI